MPRVGAGGGLVGHAGGGLGAHRGHTQVNTLYTVTKTSINFEIYLEELQGPSFIAWKFSKIIFRGVTRNISRFLFCINWIKLILYNISWSEIRTQDIHDGMKALYQLRYQEYLFTGCTHFNPNNQVQVKNFEMFLRSCLLNLVNILAV